MKNLLKSLTFFVAVFICEASAAQNILIEYEAKFNSKLYDNELIINESQSYWRYVQNDRRAIEDNLLNDFIIKDISQNATYSNMSIFGQNFYVKDTLNNMNWSLTDDKKTILEKECFSATTTFRGRDYIAYYSPDLLYSNGPWKFGGLPGQILEVFSVDTMFRYTATKIEYQNKEKLDYDKPLKNKFLSWDEYKVNFSEAVLKFTKALRSSGAVSDADQVTIKLDMMEFIDSNSQGGDGYKF